MKKLLAAMFVALLMVGCGEDDSAKWAEWEANPEPYGGIFVLAMIREAKESDAIELDLKDSNITDITPFKVLTDLEILDLDENQISDLTPLKGLDELRRLSLSRNRITDVRPLKGLSNLESLYLGYNEISDPSPLEGLKWLDTLWLTNNPIDEFRKASLRKALPYCKIKFTPAY